MMSLKELCMFPRRSPRRTAFARLWAKAFPSGRCKASRPHTSRVRPQLEYLEDRLVPAVIDVTTLADGTGPGTLRSAIAQANTNDANGDTNNTIDITVAGTYNIGQLGALQIFSNAVATQTGLSLTIQNTSNGTVAINGDNASRVFDINPNDIVSSNNAVLGSVTIGGVTIENGLASSGSSPSGGGIRDQGPVDLTLNNDIVTQNSAAADGGGIAMANAASTPWVLTINNTTISNNHADGAGGGVEEDGTGLVNITSSTIADNFCVKEGGGVWLDAINGDTATLNVTSSIVSDNTAEVLGGGIGNAGTGTVTIAGSTIADNFTGDIGGGFANLSSFNFSVIPAGTLIVQNSLFLDNSAGIAGGGIEASHVLTITNSEIKGNAAGHGDSSVFTAAHEVEVGSSGGGLYLLGGTLTLTDSTVAENTSNLTGGGIWLTLTGTATVTGSTIAGNTALSGVNGVALGGGISDEFGAGNLTLLNDTITYNFANAGGGLFSNSGQQTTLTVQNTIIAQNTATEQGPDVDGGPTTDLGGNLIGILDNLATGFTAATDRTGTVGNPLNPQLGPLTNNGGPVAGAPGEQMTVETEALLPGSSAIGNGVAAGAPTTDERGFPQLTAPDIGAFQFQNVPLTVNVMPATPTATLNGTETFSITVTNTGGNALPDDNSTLVVSLSAGLTTASPLTFTLAALPAGRSQSFTVTTTAATLGTQTLTATVTSPDANPNPVSGNVTVNVIASPPTTTLTPLGSLTPFAFGFGPTGIDLFEIDSAGDIFAVPFMGGGAPVFLNTALHLPLAMLQNNQLLALLTAANGQNFVIDIMNPFLPSVLPDVLAALHL